MVILSDSNKLNCHTILFAHSFDEYFYLPKRRRMYWHFSLLPSVLPRSHESLMQSCHSRSSVIRLRVSLITMFDGWQQPWSTPWLIPTSTKQNTQNLYNQKMGAPPKAPIFILSHNPIQSIICSMQKAILPYFCSMH